LTQPTSSRGATRRTFLTTSAATVAGAATLAGLTPSVHAGGSDVLRIGLIGCGDRGTGAATQALSADPNLKLVAMGDVFKDRIQEKLALLRENEKIAKKIDVKAENCFDGFDAYKRVLASGVDVVLLTTPPHFRPIHLQAAVEAKKHVFCEKPMAVDVPGVRKVIAASRAAKKQNTAIVAGFCYRYERAKQETMKRIHDGQIGDIVALHTTYNAGLLWSRKRKEGWSDMEWQLRNWLYFTWLSGDHIVEQHCHSLDKMKWALKDQTPIRAVGMGGRQTRTDPVYGNIFDHHAVVFEFAKGVKLFSFCRQQGGDVAKDVNDYVMGTAGTCSVMKHKITGKKPWTHRPSSGGKPDDMYQNEHDDLFASIRAGRPINDGEWMTTSTLLAIMGRLATYTGQVITWEKLLKSKEDLSPPKYDLKAKLKVAPVAMPGVTEFK
jgi:predicted dehydrogenase